MLWVFHGHEDGHVRKVTTSTEVTNSKEGDQRRRFAISDMDYRRAERHAAKEGLTLLGCTTAIRCIRPFQVNTIWPWPFSEHYIIVSVQPEGTDHAQLVTRRFQTI